MSTDTYTIEQVSAAVNKAADDILDATEAEDEGLRDAVNLLVNAGLAYLVGSATTLEEAVEIGYDADLTEVLGWIAQGIR